MKNKILLLILIITFFTIAFGIINSTAETYGDLSYTISNGEVTITGCDKSIAIIEIPETIENLPVTSIGDSAFSNHNQLVSITITDSVTSIGDSAFYECSNLTSITIPQSIISVGDSAFNRCNSLRRVYIKNIEAWCNIEFSNEFSNPLFYAENLYLNNKRITDLIIPDSVTSIKNYAFEYCTDLTTVTLPDNVISIGDSAFKGCKYLININIPDNVSTIGYFAFSGCKSLTNITIPDSVTTIKNYAFSGCDSFTNIKIPNSVTSIGEGVFSDCDSLTSMTIPDNVASIGNYIFSFCDGLKNVIIGNGIQLIPDNIFYNCKNIEYVFIPKSVLCIKYDAFSYCPSLNIIFYEGSEEEWNDIRYYQDEITSNAKIVHNSSIKTYKFETNCDVTLPDITDYAVFESPDIKNDMKAFQGWYDNKNLMGEPVTFPYCGKSTTLYASWTDKTGLSFDDAFTAKDNSKYAIANKSGQMIYYEFVPKFTGEYRFYSIGYNDTIGYLYNSYKNQIAYNDDDKDGYNFQITYELTAGNTYYIATKGYSSSEDFTLVIETDCIEGTKTVCVKASDGEKIFITIPSYLPENAQIMLSCYKSGELVELESAPNKNETIYFVVTKDFDSAKVMVWDSFDKLKPLCTAEIVN